jgi:predicted site-specific integrase-resolvase
MRVTIYARVSTSDQKSVREVEEYVVHPNQIKKLKFGQSLNVQHNPFTTDLHQIVRSNYRQVFFDKEHVGV